MREKLAEYAHVAWSGWMKHLFGLSKKNEDGSVTIPALLVDRWTRQLNTEYKDLSDAEKDSDRAEADRMIEIGVQAAEACSPGWCSCPPTAAPLQSSVGRDAAECDHSAAGPKDSFCPKCLHHIG